MMMGQGNRVEPRAMWKMPGATMATSHRMVFRFSICFLSEVVIGQAKLMLRRASPEMNPDTVGKVIV